MSDETSRNVALGWHDDARMASDYKLVDEYLKMEKPYDIKTAYTNEFLDKSVKMPPSQSAEALLSGIENAAGPAASRPALCFQPNSGPATAKVRAVSSKLVERR
jgi:hypothetical protein